MKHIMSMCMLLFVVCSMNGQGKLGPITISYGQEIEDNKEKIVRISGELNGKIYTLAQKKKKYFLKMFSSDGMKEIGKKEVKFAEKLNFKARHCCTE